MTDIWDALLANASFEWMLVGILLVLSTVLATNLAKAQAALQRSRKAGAGQVVEGDNKSWADRARAAQEIAKSLNASILAGETAYLKLLDEIATSWRKSAVNKKEALTALRMLLEECCHVVARTEI